MSKLDEAARNARNKGVATLGFIGAGATLGSFLLIRYVFAPHIKKYKLARSQDEAESLFLMQQLEQLKNMEGQTE